MFTARAMTRHGYDRLQGELNELVTVRRPELLKRLREARAAGEAENDLLDLLDESAQVERRIGELKARLAAAQIAAPAANDGTATIGTRVGLRDSDGEVVHYELVGAGEADPARGRISISSPVAAAIAGRRTGDRIDIETPRFRVRFELVSVVPV